MNIFFAIPIKSNLFQNCFYPSSGKSMLLACEKTQVVWSNFEKVIPF